MVSLSWVCCPVKTHVGLWELSLLEFKRRCCCRVCGKFMIICQANVPMYLRILYMLCILCVLYVYVLYIVYVWNIYGMYEIYMECMKYGIYVYSQINTLKNETNCLNFEKLHFLINEFQWLLSLVTLGLWGKNEKCVFKCFKRQFSKQLSR